MASSGTSSFLGRWDVFLSFRGEDTRLNFTDHLYSALTRMGIDTFRDHEGLERGGEIQPSLLKAIEESKSRREKGQIVVPVFYHLDPSDVWKQTGSFGEAFARYGEVTEMDGGTDRSRRSVWMAYAYSLTNLSHKYV
ncbi:Disease resistance protein RPP5 [Vitis vinifera]|uniref:Disease resistance protein RPP5 n=1 Tax=Vitis vinifera TaxID=29760 RepID=A0A438G3X3_VITVI|nr:Disease resistance protein RPP5 [Vitis vinifera]